MNDPIVNVPGRRTVVQGAKCPIPSSVLIMYGPTPHGRMLPGSALECSGWKLNGVPLQVNGSAFMNPLAAEAEHPAALVRVEVNVPGFIRSESSFGVNVARSDSCGLGGPVDTPLDWMKPKFTGSVQLGLHRPLSLPEHSRLSMVSAAHQ